MSGSPFGQDFSDPLAGATRCPHCEGVAEVSSHPQLKQVCNLCGAPRIDVEGVKLSGREQAPLKRARTAERQRLQWKAGGIFGGAVSGFVFLLWAFWALLFGAGAIWATSGLLLGAPMLLLAIAGFARSKGKVADVQRALDEAWRFATRDVIAAHPNGISTEALAAKLPITERQAEQLAAELSVDNSVVSRVTEDGRLVLQASGGPRIDTGSVGGGARVESSAEVGDPLEERFAELEQAEREAAAKRRGVE